MSRTEATNVRQSLITRKLISCEGLKSTKLEEIIIVLAARTISLTLHFIPMQSRSTMESCPKAADCQTIYPPSGEDLKEYDLVI